MLSLNSLILFYIVHNPRFFFNIFYPVLFKIGITRSTKSRTTKLRLVECKTSTTVHKPFFHKITTLSRTNNNRMIVIRHVPIHPDVMPVLTSSNALTMDLYKTSPDFLKNPSPLSSRKRSYSLFHFPSPIISPYFPSLFSFSPMKNYRRFFSICCKNSFKSTRFSSVNPFNNLSC